MKIVHLPTEISGQMELLCHGLEERGHTINGYNWFQTYLNYSGDIVQTDAYELVKHFQKLTSMVDVFHFHNGNTLTMSGKELGYLKQQGKKLVMHHWGNDVRTVAGVRERNPYPLPESYLTDGEIDENLRRFSSYFDTAIVQDYEVLPYVENYYNNVHVIPLACRLDDFTPHYPSTETTVPTIVHAPTNRQFKGTSYVEAAIGALNEKGLTFNYRQIEKMSHQEAKATYREADIIVDQVLAGTYGMLSVEAMALGKVVVAYIRDDVKAKLPPHLPIVVATPETLATTLEELLNNPVKRHEIGVASRKFVEEYHDHRRVAEMCEAVYETL